MKRYLILAAFLLFFCGISAAQTCGPPNYACPGRAVINDNCILQILGGGASSPLPCPQTDTVVPNLGNGSTTCAQPCTATDPQFGNIVYARCTDGQLNGLYTSGTFLNRTYEIGQGGSGDSNSFNTDATLAAVFDTGSRFIIESIDKTTHSCYPVLSGGTPFLPGGGEFSSTIKGKYFSFFPGSAYTVSYYTITCTNPGHSGGCATPTGPTLVADFSTVLPYQYATQWTASTSYTFGQYVFTYMTNSQSATVTAASCASNVITYTTSGLASIEAGGLMTVSGLSTYNGTAIPVTTANGAGTSVTSATTCTNGSISGATGTMTEGSKVLFQEVASGTHNSGGTTPTWNSAFGSNVTDGASLVWTDVGTTNFNQGGGWTTIGGASVDETQFSGGMSNNNFDATANGALGINMTGNQNTGSLVYTYDSTADTYYEWQTMTGVSKSFTCTFGTGPQCTRGAGGVTVMGAISPASPSPNGQLCTNTSPFTSAVCQFYLHNVKIFKGGTWNEVTPEFCAANSSGPGNCPQTGKYMWSKGTTTANMTLNCADGHETEWFTQYYNFAGNQGGCSPTGIGQVRLVTGTASNTFANFFTNSNSTQWDGHYGHYYLNGATSDAIVTPIGGATFDITDFPYINPYQNELLVIPTCGSTSPVVTTACSGTELQANQTMRAGHAWAYMTSQSFNTQFIVTAYSQDGTVMGVSTDWIGNFGATNGGTVLGGFPWSASFNYTTTTTINPTSGNATPDVFTETGSCTSGATKPSTWTQTLGGTVSDGTCTWVNGGPANARGDVVLAFLNTGGLISIPPPAPIMQIFALASKWSPWWLQEGL